MSLACVAVLAVCSADGSPAADNKLTVWVVLKRITGGTKVGTTTRDSGSSASSLLTPWCSRRESLRQYCLRGRPGHSVAVRNVGDSAVGITWSGRTPRTDCHEGSLSGHTGLGYRGWEADICHAQLEAMLSTGPMMPPKHPRIRSIQMPRTPSSPWQDRTDKQAMETKDFGRIADT